MNNRQLTCDKRLTELIRLAEKAGWTITKTKRSHLHWRSPAGQLVVTGSSPSDRRAYLNHVSLLRRCGLQV